MMAVYLELSARSDVEDEYASTLRQFLNHVQTIPSWAQLPKKEFKARIVELDLIVDLKSSSDVSFMKGLHIFFVNLYVLVPVVP